MTRCWLCLPFSLIGPGQCMKIFDVGYGLSGSFNCHHGPWVEMLGRASQPPFLLPMLWRAVCRDDWCQLNPLSADVSAVPLDDRGSSAGQGALECFRIMGHFHEVQISLTYKGVVNWIYPSKSLLTWLVCELWEGEWSGSKYCLPSLTLQWGNKFSSTFAQ